jgi:hypothetical protein
VQLFAFGGPLLQKALLSQAGVAEFASAVNRLKEHAVQALRGQVLTLLPANYFQSGLSNDLRRKVSDLEKHCHSYRFS